MTVKEQVTLTNGLNSFYVIALNDGGEKVGGPFVINCQYTPVVRIKLLSLENAGAVSNASGEPRNGMVPFDAVQVPNQKLTGEVVWEEGNDDQMEKVEYVRVSVNGKQLLPFPKLEKALRPGVRKRLFHMAVELTQAENNIIEVRLGGAIVLHANSHKQLQVACANPAAAPKTFAHLLILSEEDEDKATLQKRVLSSLKATAKDGNEFTMEGLSEGGKVYGPLVGSDSLNTARLYGELSSIRQKLGNKAGAKKLNDVIIIYYRGREVIDGSGHYLTLGGSASGEKAQAARVDLNQLAERLDHCHGSRIWFLDTAHDSPSSVSAQTQGRGKDLVERCDDPNSGLWRYAWQGKNSEEPDDARLIGKLTAAMNGAKKLDDVSSRLGDEFSKPNGEKQPWRSTKYGPLMYHYYLAPGLRDWSLLSE
jgi:hypothetical protein